MKRHLQKHKEEEERNRKFTEDRERLRQKKEQIKELIQKKKKADYRQFLRDQVEEKKLRDLEDQQEEQIQAETFNKITLKFQQDKENQFKEKVERQNQYKKELMDQINEKKLNQTRKLEKEKMGEDPNEFLAKIISNDKQIELLQRGLCNN